MTSGPGNSLQPAGQSRLLASSADRERAADVIKEAFAEGRINKDECDARISQAYAGRTFADLAMATANLPGAQPPLPVFSPARAAYPLGPAVYLPVTSYQPVLPSCGQLPKTNSMAIASLCWGLAELVTLGLTSFAAVLTGFVAVRQMRRTGERGTGLAVAGLVLGWLGVIFLVLVIIAVVFAPNPPPVGH